jgi:hypothetical protein
MDVKKPRFRGFRHRETESEESPEIAKGEFTKGPRPSIKEDTWKAVKGLGKGPKDFGSRRTGSLISQRERFWHFRNQGFERQRTGGTLSSQFPESRNPIVLNHGPSFRHFGTQVFERPGVGRRGVPTREVAKSQKKTAPE